MHEHVKAFQIRLDADSLLLESAGAGSADGAGNGFYGVTACAGNMPTELTIELCRKKVQLLIARCAERRTSPKVSFAFRASSGLAER
jgi:hypothetical protein